jgi:hypothetical protein
MPSRLIIIDKPAPLLTVFACSTLYAYYYSEPTKKNRSKNRSFRANLYEKFHAYNNNHGLRWPVTQQNCRVEPGNAVTLESRTRDAVSKNVAKNVARRT